MAHSAAGDAPWHKLAGSVNQTATLAFKSGTTAFKAILLFRMILTPRRICMVCGSRQDLPD
jgi:hypothetical protein